MMYFILINILGMFSMFLDKQFAKRHMWRISELQLLLIAMVGGSLGSWVGMYLFRHKTKHCRFYVGIPFIILIQLGLYTVLAR